MEIEEARRMIEELSMAATKGAEPLPNKSRSAGNGYKSLTASPMERRHEAQGALGAAVKQLKETFDYLESLIVDGNREIEEYEKRAAMIREETGFIVEHREALRHAYKKLSGEDIERV